MADFSLHTDPEVTRYSPWIKYFFGAFVVALVALVLWARQPQVEAQLDNPNGLSRSPDTTFHDPATKKKEVVEKQAELPPAVDIHKNVEPLQLQSVPLREPKPPNPDIARRREARLKAMEAKVLVEGFGQAAPQQVASNAQQLPTGQMPNQWPQGEIPGQLIEQRSLPAGMGGTRQMLGESSFTGQGQYLAGTVQKARSPYQVNAGTVIPVTLKRPIVSDLEGQTSGLVSLDVYDSVSGQYKLIPQGSVVVGMYDTNLGPQARLNVAYRTLYFPNGCSLSLQGMPSMDGQGFAGLTDEVNRHFWQRYGAVAGLSLLTAAIGLAGNNSAGNYHNYSPAREAAAGASQVLGQAVEEDLRQAMNIPPTVTIRGGYPFNIDVTQDMVLKPYDPQEICHENN